MELPNVESLKSIRQLCVDCMSNRFVHVSPPPLNQIALVVATTPFESKGMFEAVTGTIQLKTQELFLVDGRTDVNVSYSFAQAKVKKYKKPEETE